MPKDNRFRHQRYSGQPPAATWQLLQAPQPPPLGSGAEREMLRAAGESYRQAGVAAVILIHGSFVGDDVLGMARNISRAFPEAARRLRGLLKQSTDRLVQDAGNYSPAFAEQLQRDTGLNVQRFCWSSENHHLARAHAAVCLIDDLAGLNLPSTARILLWGHSHGGNVLSLVTNLLAAHPQGRRKFFRACRSFCRWPRIRGIDMGPWQRVQDLLRTGLAERLPALDIVTFGTPIRYGWDAAAYARLLHFVHHRPSPELPSHQTVLPHSWDEVLRAAAGDYIQHWGIAGTNLPPPLLQWRSWLADLRLGRLLQHGVRRRDLLARLKTGSRVADEGLTLLVDYGPLDEFFPRNLAGHAVYTQQRWLPFHAAEIARRFYGA